MSHLVLPAATEIVLVIDERRATVVIRQGELPNATVVFDSVMDARKYIRSLKEVVGIEAGTRPAFSEIDLVNRTEIRGKV
jgi:hypothetical protein